MQPLPFKKLIVALTAMKGRENTKPIKRLKHLLTKGNLWLYILSIIRQRKRIHAYALDDAIEQEFSFRPNKIMVYIVLYKLEGERFIKLSGSNVIHLGRYNGGVWWVQRRFEYEGQRLHGLE